MAKTLRASDTRLEIILRKIRLKGLTEIMFDRYAGDNKTKLAWEQKVYLIPGTDIIALPATNIVSFLTAHNTNSAPKRLRDKRAYKDIANACLSFTTVAGLNGHQGYIPFLREGEPIKLGRVENGHDPISGLYMHRSVARLDKGIPNPKERPVLPLPWELEFSFQIFPNQEIKEQDIKNLFSEGGLAIGLGTFRGVYGKFVIDLWK